MFPLGELREVTGSVRVLVDSFTSALRWLSAYRFAPETDLQPSNSLKFIEMLQNQSKQSKKII